MKYQQACHPWQEKIAARHPEDLTEMERSELYAHLTSCHNCTQLREQYAALSLRIHAAVANEPAQPQAILPVSLLEDDQIVKTSRQRNRKQMVEASRQYQREKEGSSPFAQGASFAFLVLFLLSWVILWPGQAPSTTTRSRPAATGEQKLYSVVGKSTLSVDAINAILQIHHSPLAGKGQIITDLGVAYQIDPAFILAVAEKDSNLGTTDWARQRKSFVELRCLPGYRCLNNYAVFDSWEEGIDKFYQLIRLLYVDQWKLTTVDAIMPRYTIAPDEQKERQIITRVKLLMDAWRAGKWSYVVPTL